MAKINNIQYSKDDTTVIIRNPKVEDAKQLINHLKTCFSETKFLTRTTEEFNPTIEEEEKFIKSQLSSEKDMFLVAEVKGQIVGMCGLIGSTLKSLEHKIDLGITLQKEFWGLGIGTKLMETAIDWAKDKGIKKVTLKVDTLNHRAIGLYKKMGFEVEGRLLKDKLAPDGSWRNAYMMALFIDSKFCNDCGSKLG